MSDPRNAPFSPEALDKLKREQAAKRREIQSRFPNNRQGRRAAVRAIKKAGLG